MKLDVKPKLWEDREALFSASLVENGVQSSTLKSYMSAFKGTFLDDNYSWDNSKLILNTITRECRLKNNRILT